LWPVAVISHTHENSTKWRKQKLKIVKFSSTFRRYFLSAGRNLPRKYVLLSRQQWVMRTVWLCRTRYLVISLAVT